MSEGLRVAIGLITITALLALAVFGTIKTADAHVAGGGCYAYGSKWFGTVNHQYNYQYAFNPPGPDRHAHKVKIYHNPPGGFQGYKNVDCPDRGRCPIH